MSTQRNTELVVDELDDETVYEYLTSHPDFFERHGRLLTTLRIPHTSGGGTISLVERQVSVLRQKNLKLEQQFKELIDVARGNDALSQKIHELVIKLIGAKDFRKTLDVVESQLRVSFSADQAVMVLFGDPKNFDKPASERFLVVTARDSSVLGPFETFISAGRPRCGQIRDSQRDFLFGKETDEIGSVALLPLGRNTESGFIAIGSANADHFHPGMSIDYLARIGELVSAAIKRF